MQSTFFETCFRYQLETNHAIIDTYLKNTTGLPDRCVELFSHMLNAHQIWNSRIKGERLAIKPFDDVAVAKWKEVNQSNFEQSMLILDEWPLSAVISYENFKGEQFESRVEDILFHIINHSTHHRGQIVSMIRSAGFNPPITDFIFWIRK